MYVYVTYVQSTPISHGLSHPSLSYAGVGDAAFTSNLTNLNISYHGHVISY